jgi:hypothetical protein
VATGIPPTIVHRSVWTSGLLRRSFLLPLVTAWHWTSKAYVIRVDPLHVPTAPATTKAHSGPQGSRPTQDTGQSGNGGGWRRRLVDRVHLFISVALHESRFLVRLLSRHDQWNCEPNISITKLGRDVQKRRPLARAVTFIYDVRSPSPPLQYIQGFRRHYHGR